MRLFQWLQRRLNPDYAPLQEVSREHRIGDHLLYHAVRTGRVRSRQRCRRAHILVSRADVVEFLARPAAQEDTTEKCPVPPPSEK
jgi:hypothetical protein